MPRSYRDPFDGKVFYNTKDLYEYTKKYNSDKIPKEYKGDIDHYLFDYRNGFKGGKCQVCGAPTEWDKSTGRYKILCEPLSVRRFLKHPGLTIKTYISNKGNSCSDIMRKEYTNNISKKYNTDNLMADPEYQQMLLTNKKIAKKVNFKGKELVVIGSYEERFVKVCDRILSSSDDLISPGPTIKYHNSVTDKDTYTIWDFYIKSIDTIISIKDEGFNKEDHESVVNKRKADIDKFKSGLSGEYFGVIELNGIKEIDSFDKIYKEIIEAKKTKKNNYIKYPKYFDKYK